MGANPDDYGTPSAMGLGDGVGHGAERFHRKNVRKSAIELAEAATAAPGPGEVREAHFAMAFLERIGLQIRNVDRRNQAAVWNGRSCPVRKLCQGAVPQSIHTGRALT